MPSPPPPPFPPAIRQTRPQAHALCSGLRDRGNKTPAPSPPPPPPNLRHRGRAASPPAPTGRPCGLGLRTATPTRGSACPAVRPAPPPLPSPSNTSLHEALPQPGYCLRRRPPPPQAARWGGRVRGQKEVCGPKIGLKFPAPLIDFIFLPDEQFSDVGGCVGRPGLGRAPDNPQATACPQPNPTPAPPASVCSARAPRRSVASAMPFLRGIQIQVGHGLECSLVFSLSAGSGLTVANTTSRPITAKPCESASFYVKGNTSCQSCTEVPGAKCNGSDVLLTAVWMHHTGRGGGVYGAEFLCHKFCAKCLCAICSVFLRICTGGPPLILPPALKWWGTPRRQGLCRICYAVPLLKPLELVSHGSRRSPEVWSFLICSVPVAFNGVQTRVPVDAPRKKSPRK